MRIVLVAGLALLASCAGGRAPAEVAERAWATYEDCLKRLARQLDDGRSDAMTIGATIAPACETAYVAWMDAKVGPAPTPRAREIAISQSKEYQLSFATRAVLLNRRSGAPTAVAPVAAQTPRQRELMGAFFDCLGKQVCGLDDRVSDAKVVATAVLGRCGPEGRATNESYGLRGDDAEMKQKHIEVATTFVLAHRQGRLKACMARTPPTQRQSRPPPATPF